MQQPRRLGRSLDFSTFTRVGIVNKKQQLGPVPTPQLGPVPTPKELLVKAATQTVLTNFVGVGQRSAWVQPPTTQTVPFATNNPSISQPWSASYCIKYCLPYTDRQFASGPARDNYNSNDNQMSKMLLFICVC